MKTKTILKTIAFLIGWIVSFQLIPTGLHIMSKPSSIYFTLGILFEILAIGNTFYFAFKFGEYGAILFGEYRKSKNFKQENK